MWSYALYPRLGLPLIGAALKSAGHDVLIYSSKLAPIDERDLAAADLVGISTTTSTAPAGYAMADALRQRGVPVVVGGSHVTFMADEALEHADFVARGEGGEALTLELVDALQGRRELETIAGLSFTKGGRPVHNAARERCTNLDHLPVPDLSLIAGHERLKTTPIMTSWGCPFACTFCSVTAMFGRAYRWRSPENVIAELRAKRPRNVFFYDDNLAADKRRLKTLLRMMIDEDLVVPWQAQARTDVARDPELLDLMARSGCHRLALGLESIDQATLDRFEKSQSVADITQAIDALHRSGIQCHGMFVLGADTDTPATTRRTVEFARSHHIDTVMLNILTPAPGTRQFADLDAEERIFTRRWELFDGLHVVFTPRQMAPHELQDGVLRAYRRFYSTRQLLAFAARLRLTRVRDHSWCWWFSRYWSRQKSTRAYLRMLKRLRRPSGRATEPALEEAGKVA